MPNFYSVKTEKKDPPSVNGRRLHPVMSHMFVVDFENLGRDYGKAGVNTVSFSKVSGIGSSIKTMGVIQGSSPVVADVPSRINYSDIVLERGVTAEETALALMAWYRDTVSIVFSAPSYSATKVSNAQSVRGVGTRVSRRTVRIGVPGFEFTLVDAWPTAFTFGDLDANRSEVWIGTMTLKHRGLITKSY